MDYVDILSKVTLFQLMKRGELKRLAKQVTEHRFEPGDVLTTEGDHDGRLFVIVSGRAEVIKNHGSDNPLKLAEFTQGQYFGEMALVDDFTRSATVVAAGQVEAISLDAWNFREAITKHPEIAIELLQTLSRRVRALEEQLV